MTKDVTKVAVVPSETTETAPVAAPDPVAAAASEPAEVKDTVDKEAGKVEKAEETAEAVEVTGVEESEAAEEKEEAAVTATAPTPSASAISDPPDTAALLAEARAEGQKSALTGVEAIIELCTIAGDPGLALNYIQSHATVDKVRKDLLRLRAEASDALGIRSTVLPVRATAGAGANDNPVVKAAENLAAVITARTSGRQ